MVEERLLHKYNCPFRLNPWSAGGSFMVQKMDITSPIPVFYGLDYIMAIMAN